MSKQKMSYEEAVAELEKIIKAIEDPDMNMNDIEGLLKRASELITYCKKELKGYEEDFAELLDEK